MRLSATLLMQQLPTSTRVSTECLSSVSKMDSTGLGMVRMTGNGSSPGWKNCSGFFCTYLWKLAAAKWFNTGIVEYEPHTATAAEPSARFRQLRVPAR